MRGSFFICSFFTCSFFRRQTAQSAGQNAQAVKTKRLGGYPSDFRRWRPPSRNKSGMTRRGDILNYLAAALSETTTLAAESAGMATAAGSAIVSAGAATSAGFA